MSHSRRKSHPGFLLGIIPYGMPYHERAGSEKEVEGPGVPGSHLRKHDESMRSSDHTSRVVVHGGGAVDVDLTFNRRRN